LTDLYIDRPVEILPNQITSDLANQFHHDIINRMKIKSEIGKDWQRLVERAFAVLKRKSREYERNEAKRKNGS
jgi:hypothetical protein